MKVIKTNIKDLLIIKQKNNIDKRGSLREIFSKKKFGKNNFIFEYCTTLSILEKIQKLLGKILRLSYQTKTA